MVCRNGFLVNVVLIVLLCACYEVFGAKKKSKVRTVAIITDIGSCGELKDSIFANYTYYGNDDYRINFEIDVPEPIQRITYINSFERCESAAAVQCEPFLTVPIEDWCSFISGKRLDALWKILLSYFQPPLSCPFQGKYQIVEMKVQDLVDVVVKAGSLDVKNDRFHYRWTQKAVDKDKNKDVFCLWAMAYLKQSRSRPNPE